MDNTHHLIPWMVNGECGKRISMVSRKEVLTRTWNGSRKSKDQILLNEPGQICAIMDIWNAIAEL